MPQLWIDGFAVIGVLVLSYGALVCLKNAWRTLRTPVRPLASIDAPETIAIRGTAISLPNTETVSAPFTEAECLLAQWEIEEFHGHWATNGHRWRTVATGLTGTEFGITDGTGTLRIDPSGVDGTLRSVIDIGSTPEEPVTVDTYDRPPRPIREFNRNTADVPERESPVPGPHREGKPRQGDRRYYEDRLEPNEEVYLRARVERAESSQEPFIVSVRDAVDDGTFQLTDSSRRELVSTLVVGALIAVVGIGLLIAYLLTRYGSPL